MAELSNNVTLLDVAKSLDPDGKTAMVVEVLARMNPLVTLLPYLEANDKSGHTTTVRTGALPQAVWRKYNQGVSPGKSARVQITETMGMLEARSEVDEKLANLNGNLASFRFSEALAFVEGMNQQVETAFFYGTPSGGYPFMGLAPRYNALTGETKDYIISAGGSGTNDQTSIYLAVLGEQTVHGIYPKGSKAGLEHQDLGIIDAFDENNKRYRAYADLWRWDMGLCVRDHRAIVRICNIKASDLLAAGLAGGNTQAATAATNVLRAVIEAKNRIPRTVRAMGRLVAFMNARTATAFELIGLEKSVNATKLLDGQKQAVKGWDGVEFVVSDAILNTEAQVS